MKIRLQSKPVVSASALAAAPVKTRTESAFSGKVPGKKPLESGLLRLCEEIAGSLLRRHLETGDAVQVVREIRACLVTTLPDCNEARAGWIVDLALELMHVKAHGFYQRNALELSELIARAGKQLREVRNN
ncbi:MAG: hypothetical protein B9S36_04105 [Verrucomicrobiia bacterium Tous-C2TDCM]|nr:MAG: hypothetical protein B9S36_04105 [Verrucomicrobiae bacterium Tous-C2TDCM]